MLQYSAWGQHAQGRGWPVRERGEVGQRAGIAERGCSGHGQEGVGEHYAEQPGVHLHQDQREAWQEGVLWGHADFGQGAQQS